MEKQAANESVKIARDVIAKMDKAYGKNSVRFFNDPGAEELGAVIPSGSIALNLALGVGGYVGGRIVEIYGEESSGKTTLALHAIAEAQRMSDKPGLFVDAEHAFDPEYAESLGVDLDRLIICQPDNGEQGLTMVEEFSKRSAVCITVVDSVSALTPRAEIEGEIGEAKMALQARMMSQALRKITGEIYRSKAPVIFINQMREKVGVMFGDPRTTTGGNALKFYATMRLHVSRKGLGKDDDGDANLAKTHVKVTKNKVAPPFRTAEFNIVFGIGISKIHELVDFAVELGIIKKSGSHYSYGDTKIGQGIDKVVEIIGDNPDLCDMIEEELKSKLSGGKDVVNS